MSPTIKDIAEKAGVSYATVSRALNNHKDVNDETRKKVIKIAREIGYQPNAIAQGLVKKETRTIGLVIPDITNPFFPEVASGIEDAAEEAGYTIFLCNTNWSKEREANYLDVLLQKQVDGLIIAPSSENLNHLKRVLQSGRKVIFISRMIRHPNSTSIIIDNVSGAQMAVEHLIDKGHKRIGLIGGFKDISASRERLKGYRYAMEMNSLEINESYIKSGDFKRETGHVMMHELLKLKPAPTAVFAVNDLLALGAIQAIKEEGLSIPGDVAVIGFDDIEFASLPEIQLTTVSQPKYDMGRMAVDTLLEILAGDDNNINKKIMLEPRLIVRGST